uniref:Uncharacterized protein MANES_09G179700 n=1 Tax=Rhizophora mucronata TaxID=61149 RepID=A0A2P2KQD1_RHIMU
MKSVSFSHLPIPFPESSTARPVSLRFGGPEVRARSFPVVGNTWYSVDHGRLLLHGGSANFCQRFSGLKQWIIKSASLQLSTKGCQHPKELRIIRNQDKDHLASDLETTSTSGGQISGEGQKIDVPNATNTVTSAKSPPSSPHRHSLNIPIHSGRGPSLCIAVIGATGELARGKIFPALFALYYSGFLPEDVGIFGYSRKDLTDDDLRSIIASTLTCRIDHQYSSLIIVKVFIHVF